MYVVDWSGGRRLQREKRDSRDPGLSVAREAARPRPRKASARSGNQHKQILNNFSKNKKAPTTEALFL
ncbi:hypothetical protein D9X91_21035 [Falsibacillus albus]|uniref:Uncharacterized protein n=1 Tax=Falsibacillus albus TaxID=2478915 RepID=A0A3L7JLJ5_9BACI|nr:hypothetical protein D9X91_21035 [Falsibacillus albus]